MPWITLQGKPGEFHVQEWREEPRRESTPETRAETIMNMDRLRAELGGKEKR